MILLKIKMELILNKSKEAQQWRFLNIKNLILLEDQLKDYHKYNQLNNIQI